MTGRIVTTRIVRASAALAGRTVLMLATLIAANPALGQLTIVIEVPPGTEKSASVYVAGTFNHWNPADPDFELVAQPSGTFEITLPETVRDRVEFKFTLGSWERVEVDASGADLPNRTFVIPETEGATYRGRVAGWRTENERTLESTASASVSILDDVFEMPQLGRVRRIWLYLPPDYDTSTARYPVLYMHDGQNVFDRATSFAGEWGVDETLDALHADGDPGIVVAAIDNGGTRRLDEYSPWANAQYGGGEGDAYLEFIVETLKPYIDARYRTRSDRRNTGIGGSSMGGLISLYAILKYPDVFGRAAVFSPALWFAPDVFSYADAAQPPHPDTRIYMVSGALESGPGDTTDTYVLDQQRMVDLLVVAGFRSEIEVRAIVRDDGEHAEWFWRREFPEAFRWLFGGE